MADEDDAEHERAQREAQALAVSTELQRRLWDVLNDPSMNWARFPHPVAGGIAATLTRVLVALALTDPNDLGFGLKVISDVQRELVARAGTSSTPGETRH